MRLLNEKDRALANRLMRSEDVLLEICDSAHTSPMAVNQLIGAVSLLASLGFTLEHMLAFGDGAKIDDAPGTAPPVYSDWGGHDRWTLAGNYDHAAAD